MQLLTGPVATIAVTAIYTIWRMYFQIVVRRQRLLRERVTYMLWMAAAHAD